jgi:DNA-directed RNA polymerase subunit RPC12/RpoP
MAGIWTYLIPIIVFVAFGTVLAGLGRRQPSMGHDPARCTNCETPMSLRRVSIFESPTLRSMWMCPHCGNRIKSRKGVTGTAT